MIRLFIKKIYFLVALLLCPQFLFSQTTESTSSSTSTANSADGTSSVTTTTKKRLLRRSRIQELRRRQKDKKGQNIFGLGLVGFHGGLSFGSLTGATLAGAPSDGFSGLGMGALFDLQLAGGEMNSLGLKTSGPWYWHWGIRLHLDFFRRKNSEQTTAIREINELQTSFVVKYYMDMNDLPATSGIVVLNRFTFFLGIGPMWSVGISDTIENLSDRTFTKGPTQSDFFFATELGFNAKITATTYFTYDFRIGVNLSGEIDDEISGKVIDGTGGGTSMAMHIGIAYAF